MITVNKSLVCLSVNGGLIAEQARSDCLRANGRNLFPWSMIPIPGSCSSCRDQTCAAPYWQAIATRARPATACSF